MPVLSIKTKLSASLSLILIIAFAAINLLNYSVSQSVLKQNIIQDALPGVSTDIHHQIQRNLITSIEVSSMMANDTFLKDWVLNDEEDISKITKYLWEIKERYDFFSTFLISSQTLNYYHFKGLHKQISPEDEHDDWYYDFINSGKEYVIEVDTNEAAQGTLTIFINHRLNDYQGNLIGVTGVGLQLTSVGRMLHSFEQEHDKIVYLVDKEGTIQVHSNQRLVLKKNIHHREGMGQIASDLLANPSTTTVREYRRDDKNLLVMATYIPEFDWFLMVEHDQTRGMREIENNFIRNLLIGLAVTVLVIIINILMVNFFQSKLEHMAITDELTGLANRRFFIWQAKKEMARASRSDQPLSLLMMDIDHFKDVNDTYGHDVGDQVLKKLSNLLQSTLREGDQSGRMGGEEFAVLLPQTTSESAWNVAERIRALVEDLFIPTEQGTCSVTVSVGVATRQETTQDFDHLMRSADKALYQAKAKGRNRVCQEGVI